MATPYLRLMVDMYSRSKSRVVWDGVKSQYFECNNGVRQGGVASPLLFTVYMDELLQRLEAAGVGCHIGNSFMEAIGYADDLTLLSPSVKALQKMVQICAQFGEEFGVKYNPKKTMCVRFGKTKYDVLPVILLNGENVKWVKETKHLGNIIRGDLSEVSEISRKAGLLIGQTNALVSAAIHPYIQ